jgi:hypothetical protein
MAGTTSKGLRFPTAGDNPAVHTDIQNLATDVDTILDTLLTNIGPTGLIFEGSVLDTNETTVNVLNPTQDRTINFPDASGTVALTSDVTSSVTSAVALAEDFSRTTVLLLGGM